MILSPPGCAHVSVGAGRKGIDGNTGKWDWYTYSNLTSNQHWLENWVRVDFAVERSIAQL